MITGFAGPAGTGEKLNSLLYPQTALKLNFIWLCEDDNEEDDMCWDLTSNGLFSVKSAYNALLPPSKIEHDPTWARIYKLHVP